jgi:hypothetical protein
MDMAITLRRRRAVLVGLAIVLCAARGARSETIFGITYSQSAPQALVRFDSERPGEVTTVGVLDGMTPGQVALAIDFRPATGQLYLGAGGDPFPGPGARLYTVDLQTAALTPVAPAFDTTGLGGAPSFDFNPVTDEIRVTTIGGVIGTNNSRTHPGTGALAFDTDPDFAPGDVNVGFNPPAVIGIAHSNNVAGATATTLYAYEMLSDDFAIIGGAGGSSGAGTGRLDTLGDSGFVIPGTADSFGFDISGPSGIAYVSTYTEQFEGAHLFTVDLSAGRMTDAGAITLSGDAVLLDISVAVPEPVAVGPFAAAALGLLRRRTKGTKP